MRRAYIPCSSPLLLGSILLLLLHLPCLCFGYGNLQFKDDHNNTVNSLWDRRSYDSNSFPDGIPWLLNDWDPNSVIDVNLAEFQSIVNDAFETWEAVPEANIAFTYGGITDNNSVGDAHGLPPHPALDGDNVIVFDDTPDDALAITYVFTLSDEFTFDNNDLDPNNDTNFGGTDPNPDISEGTYPAGTILDADIALNKDYEDWSVIGEYEKMDLQAVLVHEIGHFIGLCHSSVEHPTPAVMYPFSGPNPEGYQKRFLKADDIAGVSAYYPTTAFYQAFGCITGNVTRVSDGRPVSGAHVVAVSQISVPQIAGVYTDSDGIFIIEGLPPGDYVLRAAPLIFEGERINEIIEEEYDASFQLQAYINEYDESSAAVLHVTAGDTIEDVNFQVANVNVDDPFEPDNTLSQAFTISTTGAAVFKTLYPNSDVDFVQFDAIEGKAYLITMFGVFYTDELSVYLYGPDENLLLAQNCMPNAWINFHCEARGPHYVKLKIRSGSQIPTDGVVYALSVTERDPVVYYVSKETGADPAIISPLSDTYSLNDGDTLLVSIDGTPAQTVTFVASQFEDIHFAVAAEVANAINTSITGGQAEAVYTGSDAYLRIASASQSPASIQLLGGTATTAFGFDTDLHSAGNATQESPLASIGYALSCLSPDRISPRDLYIADGLYYERLITVPRVGIFGGFDPSDWSRNLEDSNTTIHGGNQGSTITGRGISQIDGLVVTAGTGTYEYHSNYGDKQWFLGGGIYASGIGNSAVISNCVIIDNLIFTTQSGTRTIGGGIYIGDWSSTSVIDCVIVDNGSEFGGGIGLRDSCALVLSNYIHRNEARRRRSSNLSGEGGGLWSHSNYYYMGSEIQANTLVQNTAYRGGGMAGHYNDADTLSSNIFSCNSADFAGGGLSFYEWGGGACKNINSNVITSNRSAGRAGGIYVDGLGINVRGNLLVGNSAHDTGGGIFWKYSDSSTGAVVNNLFCGNDANEGGAFFAPIYGNGRFLNNTVAYNSGLSGGGLANGPGVGWPAGETWGLTQVCNNIIAFNVNGGFVENVDMDDATLFANNDFFANTGGSYYDADTGRWYDTAEEINALVDNGPESELCDNVDWAVAFKPAPSGTADGIIYDANTCQSVLTDSNASFEHDALAALTINPDVNQPLHFYIISNTDTTITTWGDMNSVATLPCTYQVFDYHLAKDSRNINAGMDVSEHIETDIDGDRRPLYSSFDIGADEVFPIAGDFEPDEDVDFADLKELVSYWLQNEPSVDIAVDGIINFKDIAKLAEHWLEGVTP